MILLLHGVKKNAGDYLIRERGLALVRHLLPDQQVVLRDRWRPIPPALMERADAVILCGGPGLAPFFYPRVFPLVDPLDGTTTPILPLALGWSGQPATSPDDFRFDDPSLGALRHIHSLIGWSSVRDDVSLGILEKAQVGEVRRSGCVAWYHLPSLGQPLRPPARIRRVVFTTPADVRGLGRQSMSVLRMLRRRFPYADRYCVFHRGLHAGDGTGRKEALRSRAMAAGAAALGFKVIDAAYDLSSLDFYARADLHVGYRVHAHLCFLSYRRPSLLISEDGRGRGQALTLANQRLLWAKDADLLGQLEAALDEETALHGYPSTTASIEEIERTWPVMRATIEQLA